MEIQKTNNLNFGARFINPANIKIKAPKGYWRNEQVSFIKFEPNKEADMEALNKVTTLWADKNLSGSIAEEASIMGREAHVYGLTTQTDNFDKIDSGKVLGLMTTGKLPRKAGEVEIFKIGTHPDFAYEQNHRKRTRKHIASSLIENFKSLVKSKSKKSEVVVPTIDSENELKFLRRIGLEPKNTDFVKFI